jgi:hypothetical protein
VQVPLRIGFQKSNQMKKLIFFVCCISSLLAYAQGERYLIELYFKDSQGLRDTLVVGAHSETCDSTLNPAIGEKLISSNFLDALSFGIIGMKMKQVAPDNDTHIYKPLFSDRTFFYVSSLGGVDNFLRCGSLHQAMVIKCRLTNFPLTIKWKVKVGEGIYSPAFRLNPGNFSDTPGSIVYVRRGPVQYVLSKSDSIIILANELQKWPRTEKDYVLFFSLAQAIVNTNNPSAALPTLQIYPNPSDGQIRLDYSDTIKSGTIRYFNAAGQLLKTQVLENAELDVSDLPVGLIQGLLYAEGRVQGQFRFVKVE